MAEQLSNEFMVNRPIEEAWPIITNVEKIAPCLPGAELKEIAEHEEWGEIYRGIVKVKLGAISTQFKGDAHFVSRDDETHRAELKGKGRDTGGRGNASANIIAQASSLSPTSTKVQLTTELHITGKVAQFGRGILGDVSAKLIDQFANNLNEMLDAEDDDAADPTADTRVDDDDATAQTSDRSGDNSDASTVRKIDGPAAEPVDLMDVSGGAVAKRVGPALIGLLLLFLLLRRLRN